MELINKLMADEEKILERGKNTILQEAENIKNLADSLGEEFVKVVRLILECEGKVVLTGMGKSGLVAKKISATLASTGTPSFYLHPADGIHGDMGMVSKNDVVIALSNSGESSEIVNILPTIKLIGCSLVGMVGREKSTLGSYSDYILLTKITQEACPLGLAPTTSTSCQLVLGDALALAIMEQRQFTANQYAVFHPGGALGRKLLTRVRDVMRRADFIALVKEETLIRDVLFAITKANAGAAFVVDQDEKLIGIITDGDVRRSLLKDEKTLYKEAKEIMNVSPTVISEDKLATEALRCMDNGQKKMGEIPVVRDGKPIGMICLKDLFAAGIV